ncbi:hypothetical protein TNCT_262551 [Trichonephila clavata]|uniref:Uncharacterized protein n=1 Tax=Trichonephila clavata TaxID=2740835 RepID=A0A8X6LKD2_TRICU|nr:hypothetical protein TNCT_262551 [Trichonephila clavata]
MFQTPRSFHLINRLTLPLFEEFNKSNRKKPVSNGPIPHPTLSFFFEQRSPKKSLTSDGHRVLKQAKNPVRGHPSGQCDVIRLSWILVETIRMLVTLMVKTEWFHEKNA